MKCVDCLHFRVLYQPLKSCGGIWDFGKAKCEKHTLYYEFSSERQFKKLHCVEEHYCMNKDERESEKNDRTH